MGGLVLSSPGISGMEFRDPFVLDLLAETAAAARAFRELLGEFLATP